MYTLCPKCNLNYIDETQELCDVCLPKLHYTTRKKDIEQDFYKLKTGCVYGTNSKIIYEQFCKTLGWDINKSSTSFGWRKPLYAENADSDRIRDVWFIFYPNYDKDKLDTVVEDCHVVNLILNQGDTIIEVVDENIGSACTAERIVFVRTNNGYEFFGVYKIIKNGTTRIYNRIHKNYPILK